MAVHSKLPLALKLAYTFFVAVLVFNYWRAYSPWTFLYFCDVALLLTLPALWLESPLLFSLPAVGLVLPQLLWVVDFLSGARITGMTSYMFDPKLPLLVRGLSTFHGWLPLLLLWGVWRLGYDRRALAGWTAISTAVLLCSYYLAPAPPAPADNPNLAVNINYVHGMSYEKPQTWMPSMVWLTTMIVGFPLVFYVPAHLIFRRLFPEYSASDAQVGAVAVPRISNDLERMADEDAYQGRRASAWLTTALTADRGVAYHSDRSCGAIQRASRVPIMRILAASLRLSLILSLGLIGRAQWAS